MQTKWMQVQTSSVFYIFFFIPNLKDVGSNPDTVSKTLKLCLHKYEIFPPLFSSKGLRTCRTMVKVTEKYSTQKRRLGFAALYIVTLWAEESSGVNSSPAWAAGQVVGKT